MGEVWTHDLTTKAFVYISLSFNNYARPPDSLSEMLFNLSDALMPVVCQLKNARTQCIRDNNTIVSQNNPTFLAKFIL